MKVLVIGRNYTSRLGMIRAVGELGHEVVVVKTVMNLPEDVCDARDIDYYSKYVQGYYFALESNKEQLISVIKQQRRDNCKCVIIPVDDFVASTIDEYLDDLKDSFIFPNIRMEKNGVSKIMDKNLQKKLARNIGLRVAKGWTLTVNDGKYTIPSDIYYPCFPKPQISYLGNKRCMRLCNNESELREAINEVLKKNANCPFVVEEFVEIEKEYAALGFSDGVNVVIPGMIQLLRDGSGPHKGVTLQGRLLPSNDFMPFIEKLKALLLEIGFVGLFDIDSYECGGDLYFNELNLRFGASGYALTAMGINLPQLFINHCCERKELYCSDVSDSVLFVNEKVAFEDYQGKYISLREFVKYIRESKITFIKSKVDPMPYKYFRKKFVGVVARSFVKKLLLRK